MPLPLTNTSLARRSLRYYWRSNVAVVLGVAVAVAVLVGSLLVGDSVKGSLRDLALERLGKTDYALRSNVFFREELAAAPAIEKVADLCAPAIITQGVAKSARSGVTVPEVNVLGVGDTFWPIAGGTSPDGLGKRGVAVNEQLAGDVGVAKGDTLLITVGKRGVAPSDTVFARLGRDDTTQTLRLTVADVIPSRGVGNFTLRSDQTRPRNVYISLPWLQRQIRQRNRINSVLAVSSSDEDVLDEALVSGFTLDDYGLRSTYTPEQECLLLHSARLVLSSLAFRSAYMAAVELARAETGGVTEDDLSFGSVYLANSLSLTDGQGRPRSVPYSVVAGWASGISMSPDYFDTGPLGPNDILLNAWAAQDLDAEVSDAIAMKYYVAGPRGELRTEERRFTIKGIVPMEAARRCRDLTPDFEGITDVKTMADWDPPFPIVTKHIRAKDEAYWSEFGTTPKAFLSLDVVASLWEAGRHGRPGSAWTTVRIRVSEAGHADDYARALLAELNKHTLLRGQSVEERLKGHPFHTHLGTQDDPVFGLTFGPVRREALATTKGSTDFGVLFLSMSFFLVAAAAGLVALLLRLTVERRASQYGIMTATGFAAREAAQTLMREGLVLSVVGALLGVPLGVGYAWLIVYALRRWWAGATGEFTFSLHVGWLSIVIGSVVGLGVAVAAIRWAARVLRDTPALALLAGWRGMAMQPSKLGSTRSWQAGIAAIALAVLLLLLTALGAVPATGAFFGVGAALLVGVLSLAATLLRRTEDRPSRRPPSILRLAWRGAARNPLRSMLTTGLLACVSFLVVTVAANRKDLAQLDTRDRASGAGGFSLLAKSALPIFHDLNIDEGRKALGFSAEESTAMGSALVLPLRVTEGDDASCLNMQRPASPRVLGVPKQLIERGGFRFTKLVGGGDAERGPWRELLEPTSPSSSTHETIPAFADAASAQWILKKGLGDVVEVPCRDGRSLGLRIVGLFASSIFASELLVFEDRFRQHFGSDSGYRRFLIETNEEAAVERALRSALGELGFDVTRTADTLAKFAEVQNTYLSTFQTLGGLGLLLGTFGLVTVLLRSVVERRGELAILLALGFRRGQIIAIIVLENGVLLVCGVAVGTVAALVAVAPHLLSVLADVQWLSLSATLLVCVLVGLLACALAAVSAVRGDLVQALRTE